MVNEGSGAIFGISEKIGCGLAMANKWTDPPVQIMMSFFIGVPAVVAAMVMVAVHVSIYAVPLVWVALFAYYQLVFLATPPADCESCRKRRMSPISSAQASGPQARPPAVRSGRTNPML